MLKAALKTILRPMRHAVSLWSRYGRVGPRFRRRFPLSLMLGSFRVYVPGGSSFLYHLVESDTYIGQMLFWEGLHGPFESGTIQVFARLARQARTFIDVGANTGLYSLLACAVNPHIEVLAFEPVPAVFDVLMTNLRANRWDRRCIARRQAVSNRTGIAAFHISDDPTMSSFNVGGYRGRPGRVVDVETVTLDSVLPNDYRLDLIKIDVETFELQVLEGMQRTLASSRPAIIVEFNADGPYREVARMLRSFGYELHHLTNQGILKKSEVTPTEESRNWLALCPGCRLSLV